MINFPDTWIEIKFKELLNIQYGKGLSKKKRKQDGGIPVYGSSGIIGKHDISLVQEPCLIIGRKGAVGAVYLTKGPSWPIDTVYYSIPPAEILPEFLQLALATRNLQKLDSSTTIPSLRRQDLEEVIIPIAPFNEQVRIVGRVEEFFSRLDAGVRSLQAAQTQLEQYRQITLIQAYTGKLTEKWRQKNNLNSKWKRYKLGEITKVGVGHVGPTKKYYVTSEKGRPLFSTKNISSVGFLEDEISYVNEEFCQMNKTRKLTSGDLMVARHGKSGTSSVIPDKYLEAYCLNVIYIKKSEAFLSKFLQYYLNSSIIKNILLKNASGSVQKVVNTKILQNLKLELPTINEQKIILDEVEHVFSIINIIKKTTKKNMIKSGFLKQRILKKAFEGRLIPQDPCDEPASVLLYRINAQKTKQRKLS